MNKDLKDMSSSELKAILREARSKSGKQLDDERKAAIKAELTARKRG